MPTPDVHAFHDEATFTITYVVSDPGSKHAAIIDPVLDFDPASGRTSTASADAVIAYVNDQELSVDWILETHVHADHLSGAPYIKEALGGTTAVGADVKAVQQTFKGVFNLRDLATDGSQFDRLFEDGDTFAVGSIEATVLATPGHTPEVAQTTRELLRAAEHFAGACKSRKPSAIAVTMEQMMRVSALLRTQAGLPSIP